MDTIEKLLRVQEFDCRRRELTKLKEDIPARKDEELTRLNEHKAALAAAEELVKQRQAKIKELDVEGESRKEKINKLRVQQFDLKTNEEFRAINREIETIEKQMAEVEDRQLVIMEEVEAARADVSARKRDLEEEDAAVQRDVDAWDAKMREIDGEIEELSALREAAATEVDAKWLSRYETIFTRRDRALVPIEDGVCGGCHMVLPPYIIHGAQRRTGMVSCDFCHRLVYS